MNVCVDGIMLPFQSSNDQKPFDFVGQPSIYQIKVRLPLIQIKVRLPTIEIV